MIALSFQTRPLFEGACTSKHAATLALDR